MKKLSLSAFLFATVVFAQGCSWCCTCTSGNSDKLLMLLAGSPVEADSADGIRFVSAEEALAE